MNFILLSIIFFFPPNPFQYGFKKGRVILGMETYFLSSDKYYDYNRTLHRDEFKFIERRFIINVVANITKNLSVWINVPWVWRERNLPMTEFEYREGELVWTPLLIKSRGSGVGDMWGGIEWIKSFRWIKGGAFLTMKFPTGKEGIGKDSIPIGTGQFDVGIGLRGGVNFGFIKSMVSLSYLWRNEGTPHYMLYFPWGVGTSVDPGDQLWIDWGIAFDYKDFEVGIYLNTILRTGDEFTWITANEVETEKVIEITETFIRTNSYYLLPFIGVSGKNFLSRIELIYPIWGISYPSLLSFPYTYNLPWYPSLGIKASIWYLF